MLDVASFPHLFDHILDSCDRPTLLTLRPLSKETQSCVDKRLFHTVWVRSAPRNDSEKPTAAFQLEDKSGDVLPGGHHLATSKWTKATAPPQLRNIKEINLDYSDPLDVIHPMCIYAPIDVLLAAPEPVSLTIRRHNDNVQLPLLDYCPTVIDIVIIGDSYEDIVSPDNSTTHIVCAAYDKMSVGTVVLWINETDNSNLTIIFKRLVTRRDPMLPRCLLSPTPVPTFESLALDLENSPLRGAIDAVAQVVYPSPITIVGLETIIPDLKYDSDPTEQELADAFILAVRKRHQENEWEIEPPIVEFMSCRQYEARVGSQAFLRQTSSRV